MKIPFLILVLFLLIGCSTNTDQRADAPNERIELIPEPDKDLREKMEAKSNEKINLLTDIKAINEEGGINAIIEIPSGTTDKWELNKTTGQVEWEQVNGIPRVVNYIGYPGNYGMIPRTLLSKENGGDGDPLDVIILGPPEERGSVVKSKLIGVLYLMDRGEQDDKLIAVSSNSALFEVNSLEELDAKYNGISNILQEWFTNYKGPGKMVSKGFGDKNEALKILGKSIEEFENKK